MNEPIPTNFDFNRKKAELTITWDNGESGTIPFDLLRNACPCASCRGGHENMSSEPSDDVFSIPLLSLPATQINNVDMVGNYAISITWGDGHKDGIFTWHYLYALCKALEKE